MRKKLWIRPSTTLIFDQKNRFSHHVREEKRRYALITDSRVEALYGHALQEQFLKKGMDLTLFSFHHGEQHKTRTTKEEIENRMLASGFGRDSAIIALGGGVVMDLAGFIAATYCRGLPLIAIPTTLIGMVDASIGGKTGVNTPSGKNLIGAYHPASLVLIDHHFLTSLPEKERKNGYAEILKYGLIGSRRLWKQMEEGNIPLRELIYLSIRIKKNIVEADPLENGFRRVLNFGHTIGHAIETLLDYSIGHGEAVAVGMLFESYLSMRMGHLKEREFERIRGLFKRYGFSTHLPKKIELGQLLDVLGSDKKAINRTPRFVLLTGVGSTLDYQGDHAAPVETRYIEEAYELFSS